jgi:hypothetical protein
MSNANAPAYPGEETVFGEGMSCKVYSSVVKRGGPTKREHAAIAAMQGLLGNPDLCDAFGGVKADLFEKLAKMAVIQADALLAELERTK